MKMSDFDERDERLRRAGERRAVLGGTGLHPCAIVALGTPSRPVERMMGLQSGFYRLLVLLDGLRFPRECRQPDERNAAAPASDRLAIKDCALTSSGR